MDARPPQQSPFAHSSFDGCRQVRAANFIERLDEFEVLTFEPSIQDTNLTQITRLDPRPGKGWGGGQFPKSFETEHGAETLLAPAAVLIACLGLVAHIQSLEQS